MQIKATPVASTPVGLARGIQQGGIPAPLLLALALESDGQDMPAFAAYAAEGDGQPEADDSEAIADTVVLTPSQAWGISYAAGLKKADGGSLAMLFKADAGLAQKPAKLVDAAQLARAAFNEDGTVAQAPDDYFTALLPGSVAQQEAMFVAKDGKVVTIQSPTAAFQLGIARISEHSGAKAQIVVGGIGEMELFVAPEERLATCNEQNPDPRWAGIATFKSPVAAIAREDKDHKVVVQLADGTFHKVSVTRKGWQVEAIEVEISDVVPEGFQYLGMTSAFGTGNSHALFAKPQEAAAQGPKQTHVRFVPTASLPTALVDGGRRA